MNELERIKSRDPLWSEESIEKSKGLGGFEPGPSQWELLAENAAIAPDTDALVDTFHGYDEKRRRTWREVFTEVSTLTLNLRRLDGVTAGDRIVTQLPNAIENHYARIAAGKARLIDAFLQTKLSEREVKNTLDIIEPTVSIVVPSYHGREIYDWHEDYRRSGGSLEHIFVLSGPGESVPAGARSVDELFDQGTVSGDPCEAVADTAIDPTDPSIIVPTGGTTGTPKLCLHSDYTINQNTGIQLREQAGVTPNDRALLFGPMNGGTGQFYSAATVTSRSTLYLLTDFTTEKALETTESEGISVWMGIPALIQRTIQDDRWEQTDTGVLRLLLYAGMPLSETVLDEVYDRCISPLGTYGTSITTGPFAHRVVDRREKVAQTTGKRARGKDAVLVDDEGNEVETGESGEVLIWSPNFSYFNQEEETRAGFPTLSEDGWDAYEHTGDIGRIDEDGYLTLLGRKDDMILRGGQNIFPGEVEDEIREHPEVKDIAIVPMPDDELGERACAYIVSEGEETPTLAELTDYLDHKQVTTYKWPERLEYIDELPRTAGGKLDRMDLEGRIEAELDRD